MLEWLSDKLFTRDSWSIDNCILREIITEKVKPIFDKGSSFLSFDGIVKISTKRFISLFGPDTYNLYFTVQAKSDASLVIKSQVLPSGRFKIISLISNNRGVGESEIEALESALTSFRGIVSSLNHDEQEIPIYILEEKEDGGDGES